MKSSALREGFLRRLSIRSQLLILLLTVGVGAIALTTYVFYTVGKPVRARTLFGQLTSVRNAKVMAIQDYFRGVRAHLDTLAEDEMIHAAMKEFAAAYQQLSQREIAPQAAQALSDFYTQTFLPSLAANTSGRPALEMYLPALSPVKYLQFQYVARKASAAPGPAVGATPGDDSEYGRVHARRHPVLDHLMMAMRYRDLFLISQEGNIVYSVAKEPDFGTSLMAGPYSESNLARVFAAARRHRDRGQVEFGDYAFYAPSLNSPAAFLAVPLLEGTQLLGVLAVQLPTDVIDDLMAGGRQWAQDGLGRSGEAYLVGGDGLLRSNPRFLLEDKARYLQDIAAQGVPAAVVERIGRLNSSILLQRSEAAAERAALSGQTGTSVLTDYRGMAVLAAYQPCAIPGVNWGIVAKMDAAEAAEPLVAFRRQLAIFVAVFVVGITMLASWLASRFVRPVRALAEAARKVGEGRTDVKVDDRASDEIGQLARQFDAMVSRLSQHDEEIRRKSEENEALLLNVLPAPIAQRLKSGEERIADAVPSVTVLFSDIVGFSEYSRTTDPAHVVDLLNEIVSAFDEAAERHGVERVKTMGSAYMAVSGLSVPCIDHVHRMAAFAVEMVAILRRIGERHGLRLALSVGINSGPAIAGIVGRRKFLYDLWGDTVSMAGRMQRAGTAGTIKVTQVVKDALGDLHPFARAGDFDVPGRGAQAIWVLETP